MIIYRYFLSGLFHRAIVQSGVSIYGSYIVENPREIAFQLGDHFNCNTTNSSQLVDCLRGVDASQIALSSYLLPFQTSIDAPPSDTGDDDIFLPDMPLKLMQNGEINKMPVIFGINSGDGITFGALGRVLNNTVHILHRKSSLNMKCFHYGMLYTLHYLQKFWCCLT